MATAFPDSCRAIRFGPFEADLRSKELRKSGLKLRVQGQPFQVLLVLLRRSGEVVTREELRSAVWPESSYGDVDHALNKAIAHLRDVLGDSAGTPRFVETLPRVGYRFIAAVTAISEEPDPAAPQSQLALSSRKGWRILLYSAAALAAVGVLLATISWRRPPRTASIRTLAVLPFENLSSDQGQDYFVDGLTDELITTLAQTSGLRVTARTSVLQYKKAHRPIGEIARELGVEGILEGAVSRNGNRIHVNARLMNATTGTNLWAQSYDRDAGDVDALQNELAQAVVAQAGSSQSAVSKPRRPINPAAHDAYFLGKYYATAGEAKKGRESFQKAIELQPDYAEPWAGLAHYYGGIGVAGVVNPEEVRGQFEATARKALELDDSLAEAHNMMAALYYFYKWDWQQAERESARAIELNPSYAEAHHIHGYVLQSLNRPDEALREQKIAVELDPLPRQWLMIVSFFQTRQFDAALKDAKMRVEVRPKSGGLHGLLSAAFWFKGMEKEAAEELETSMRLDGDPESALAVHRAFARGGYKAVLEYHLGELRKDAAHGYVSPFLLAEACSDLKRKDEALSYLEAAYQERSPKLVHIQSTPRFDFLHSEPRYQAIVRKMGLPPAY
jgi:TolB-like protein/DNA-binding winged helix-turn-helix (wHTH) protein